jgi:ribosome-associated toxin RatA of RatAB toxin-antitoxin module
MFAAFLPPAARADDEYIQYDFSNPAEVFKATTSETVTGRGIDPAALYEILQSGQIVIINDNPNNPDIPWMTTAGILVNAPAEQVFHVIEDIDKYPEFMPQVNDASVEKLTDDVDLIFYELGIQVLFLKVKVPYSVYHWNRPPNRVDWTMAGGEFNANMGAYEVVAVPGHADKSMLFYTSYALSRNPVVVQMFDTIPQLDLMINLSAGTLVVLAMQQRAEEMYVNSGGKVEKDRAGAVEFTRLMSERAQTLAKLSSRGKIVMIENTDPIYYTGGLVVDRPIEEVYECVSDPVGLSSVTRQVGAEILEQEGNKGRIKYHTVINLVVDFDSYYTVNYESDPPRRMSWVGEPGSDIEGVAGSWDLVPLEKGKTLAFYRNTSDLKSQGVMMRQLLKIEPTFEQAIQASQTQLATLDMKRYCEASSAQRKKMAEAAKKK